jgi:hypothetical protein
MKSYVFYVVKRRRRCIIPRDRDIFLESDAGQVPGTTQTDPYRGPSNLSFTPSLLQEAGTAHKRISHISSYRYRTISRRSAQT